jgi:hypothetical protein
LRIWSAKVLGGLPQIHLTGFARTPNGHALLDLARRATDMIELVGSGLKVTTWAIAARCASYSSRASSSCR